jgi:hypothetical protein
MSLREKSAWITLITVILCFGVYYGAVFSGAVPTRSMAMLHLALICVVTLIVLQVGLTVLAAVTTPKDGRGPRDEREKMIQARSHTIGFYVLMVCTGALIIPTHLGDVNMIDITNYAFLGLVVSTIIVSLAQIIMFRRGY